MPIADTGLSIDLNFESIEGLVGNRGTMVVHETGILCTCQSQVPEDGFVGHSSMSCSRCFGLGFVWRDAVRMDGLVSNINLNKSLLDLGWVNAGDLTFSPSTHVRALSDYDRITPTVDIPMEPQVLVRGAEGLSSHRPSRLTANQDLLYWEASRKEAIWIEDEDEVIYKFPDYQLKGRTIEWTPGAGPSVGKKYSIKYYGYPEFLVFSSPTQVWDRQRELGQQVILRRITVETYEAQKTIKKPWLDRVQDNNSKDPYDPKQLSPSLDPPR